MKIAATAPLSPEGTVTPQLHEQLRNQIVRCELPPGHRLSETDIASKFEVSRQPVREAFIKLAEERLVSIRPQRGTFVRRISVSATLTERFIREAVEADLVCRAVERATSEMVSALEAQIEHQKIAAEAGNPIEFMRLDEAFHRMLAHYAEAPKISDYLEVLKVQMNRVRHISAQEFSPEKLVVQHAAITDAFGLGDVAAAEDAMRMHLREINKDLPQIVQTFPDYFEDIEALS